jgi:hypothetical protein
LGTFGFDDLERNLAQLEDPKLADRIGVQAGGKVMRGTVLPAIKEALPVGTRPTLRRRRRKDGSVAESDYGRVTTNIRVKKIRKPAGRQTLLWTVTTDAAFWWWMNEFGTISQPANPVIRTTWARVAPDMPVQIGQLLFAGIDRAMRKKFGTPDATGRST